jgi:hypothetical protein
MKLLASFVKLVWTRNAILSLQLHLLFLGHYELEAANVNSLAAALSSLTCDGERLVRTVTH